MSADPMPSSVNDVASLLFQLLVVCAMVVLSFLPMVSVRASDDVARDRVLGRIREALGIEPLQQHKRGIVLEGAATQNGREGPYRLQFTPGGREFARRIEGGIVEAVSFNGKVGWGLDWSGRPWRLELGDLEVAQMAVWVQSGQWLGTGIPLDIRLAPSAADQGPVALELEIRGGRLRAELLVDRTTWRPSLLRHRPQGSVESWEFRDYKPALGGIVPHTVVHHLGEHVDTYMVQSVREATVAEGTSRAELTAPRPDDTRFDSAIAAEVPLKRTPTGHVLVRPKVNGRDVGWFILDTGCGLGMLIAPGAAAGLELASAGELEIHGAGKASKGVLKTASTFSLGPITIARPVLTEIPQETVELLSKSFGIEVAGVCGFDLFSRAVVEFDKKGDRVTIHDPASYKLPAGRWENLVLHQKIPCVNCRFEGNHEGLFRLDTGAAHGSRPLVLFHAPAVVSLDLLKDREVVAAQTAGAGGQFDARIGSLKEFVLGGRRFADVTAVFALAVEGALTDVYTLGTFGGELLTPFTIVFDYSHQRIAFIDRHVADE